MANLWIHHGKRARKEDQTRGRMKSTKGSVGKGGMNPTPNKENHQLDGCQVHSISHSLSHQQGNGWLRVISEKQQQPWQNPHPGTRKIMLFKQYACSVSFVGVSLLGDLFLGGLKGTPKGKPLIRGEGGVPRERQALYSPVGILHNWKYVHIFLPGHLSK